MVYCTPGCIHTRIVHGTRFDTFVECCTFMWFGLLSCTSLKLNRLDNVMQLQHLLVLSGWKPPVFGSLDSPFASHCNRTAPGFNGKWTENTSFQMNQSSFCLAGTRVRWAFTSLQMNRTTCPSGPGLVIGVSICTLTPRTFSSAHDSIIPLMLSYLTRSNLENYFLSCYGSHFISSIDSK